MKGKNRSMVHLPVGPETVRMLELGHPWVIADRYTKGWPVVSRGELAAVVDGNGRFLGTAICDPGDRVVARLIDSRPVEMTAKWLSARIEAAVALRHDHMLAGETTAYRVVNGEGDGLPGFTVDRYGQWLMVQLYSEAWRPHLGLLTDLLRTVLNPVGIYEKQRPRETRQLEAAKGKRLSRLLWGKPAPARLTVQENGISFSVEMEEGLNTGLFLDQRRSRRDLMERVAGKRFLNLFAYTGAFSVAAAVAGASAVTSVDVSSGYLAWARDNFAANNLDARLHEIVTGDCFAVLNRFRQEKRRWDVILMDPPSFSTTASSRFSTRQGTSELVAAALPLLEEGSLLITSSNHQKTDLAEYLKELRRGALAADCSLRVIQTLGQPEDFPYPVTFPEGRYLKYVIAVKGPGL